MVESLHGLLVDPPLELRPFVAGGRITGRAGGAVS
jgi:hypothetical protein